VLLAALALALAGCGEPHYAKFSGAKGKAYEIEHDTCQKKSLPVLTGQLDLPADASTQEAKVRIAQKVAERYKPRIREGAYEGCLDGLAKRRS
jgi:hypothetical protein